MTVIMAKVYLKESCDPSIPFDCAPVIGMVGAADAEQRASVHGVEFQEETEEEWGGLGAGSVSEEFEEVEPSEPEMGLCCLLEPDRAWDDSVCRDLTGLSEEEAKEEKLKMELLLNLQWLRDEGVI